MRRPSRSVLALLVTTALTSLAVPLTAACQVEGPTAGRPAPTGDGEAAGRLSRLTVRPTGTTRGYSRARFRHWTDQGQGCDTRDVVLRRDGERVRTGRGCEPTAGRWFSRYDAVWIGDDRRVDIDHTVPLANAWRSGAAQWSAAARQRFANDLTSPQLLAVSATSNRSKGDQSPDQWRPSHQGYWCEYAVRWIMVKHTWKLSVTSEEKAELGRMLQRCPGRT